MYYCVSAAANIFDVIVTFMFFDDLLSWKDIKLYQKLLLGVFMFTATAVNNIFVHNKIMVITISIAVLLAVTGGFKGKVTKKILVVVGYMLLVIIADLLVTLLSIQIFSSDINVLMNTPGNARMINTILSKPVFLLLVRIVSVFVKKENFKLYKGCSIALLTIPVVNIALIISMIQFYNYINTSSMTMIYVASFCILYNTILVFFLFERIMGMASLKNEYDMLENQLVIQKEQIAHYNDITAAHVQTRKLKHDLANHIISIKSYIEDGKKDECLQYLDSLTDYANINSDIIDTGNSVIDAIFTAKRNLAREKDIDFSADIQIPENLKINSSDCCVIFGNALDNAIEACDKVQGDKYIKVSLIYQNGSLMCKIANSMNETKNPLLKTTKADKINHGIGLKNIRETLNKYSSMLRVEQNAGEFVLSFIIYEVN